MEAIPTTIKLEGGNDSLSIQWADGHRSMYPYRYLREKCPCATCTQTGPPPVLAPSPFPIFGVKPLKPDRAELVGRYALQIYWNDGHSSGIYGFDFLRMLCPCAKCVARREGA